MFNIASWNVNSLRIRLDYVLTWMESQQISVLAIQETKVIDEKFPLDVFTEKGYFVSFTGQKNYNGVAIISKYPITDVLKSMPDFSDTAARTIAVSVGGYRIINFYIPNGAALGTDKFAYKLSFLAHAKTFIQQQLAQFPRLVVVGDFNIAPEDRDVHDPALWAGSVLVSPEERAEFFACLELGLCDSFRLFSQAEKEFSWWDYRGASFARNRGLRIDHILLSEALVDNCVASNIDTTPRKWDRPSDHAPVWVTLKE